MSWINFVLDAFGEFFSAFTAKEKIKLSKTHYYIMNGAGNRFVILDARKRPGHMLSAANIRHIANPHSGYGCDQLIVLEAPSVKAEGEVFMRIYNADGSQVSACGNATRCVGWLLMKESGRDRALIQTLAGQLACENAGVNRIRVNMGPARLTHAEIPVAEGVPLSHIALEGMTEGMAVGMGNPHVVFFVPDVHAVDVARIGPLIEHSTQLFPERVNVSIAKIIDRTHISLRVWERGAGLTQACGTAACATLVAAVQRNIAERTADITLPGGILSVEWQDGGDVFLTGPVEWQAEGEIAL